MNKHSFLSFNYFKKNMCLLKYLCGTKGDSLRNQAGTPHTENNLPIFTLQKDFKHVSSNVIFILKWLPFKMMIKVTIISEM